MKSLLKYSKFVHEYRFEIFSEQEEKVYQKNLEKLRNLFGVEKTCLSLDVISWNHAGAKYYQLNDKGNKMSRKAEKNATKARFILKGLVQE